MELLSGASIIADIGCDHGRLSCALVQRKIAKKCIAIDVSTPSLEKAVRLARQVGVEDFVETRLGDGLAHSKRARRTRLPSSAWAER